MLIEEPHSMTGDLLRVSLLLALLLPLVWAVSRLYGRNLRHRVGNRLLGVVDIVALAPGRFLYVVRAGKRLLVLGVTAQSISLISEIAEEDEVAAWLQGAEDGRGRRFQGVFRKALDNVRGEADE